MAALLYATKDNGWYATSTLNEAQLGGLQSATAPFTELTVMRSQLAHPVDKTSKL